MVVRFLSRVLAAIINDLGNFSKLKGSRSFENKYVSGKLHDDGGNNPPTCGVLQPKSALVSGTLITASSTVESYGRSLR